MSQCGLTDIAKISTLPEGKVTILDGFSGSVLNRQGADFSSYLLKKRASDYTVVLTPSSLMGDLSAFDEIDKLGAKNKLNLIETSTAVFKPISFMSVAALHRYKEQLARVGETDEMAMEVITEMTYLSEDKVQLWREHNLSAKELIARFGVLESNKFMSSPDLGILTSSNRVEPLVEGGGDLYIEMKVLLDEYLDNENATQEERVEHHTRLESEFKSFRLIEGAETYLQNTKAIFDLGRERGIALRPRGSAGSSLAIFLMIDEDKRLNPIEWEFTFSRFMDVERKEMPDVDIDVSDVPAFTKALQDKFGSENVVGLKTFGTVKSPKALMKTAMNALSNSVGVKTDEHFKSAHVEFLKLFKPYEKRVPKYMSFDDFLAEPKVRAAFKSNEIMHQMIAVARRFQNLYISTNTHNGGVLFSTLKPCSKTMAAMKLPDKQLLRSELSVESAKLMGQIKYDAMLPSDACGELELARKHLKEMHNVVLKEDIKNPALYKAVRLDALDGIYQLSGAATRPVIASVQPENFFDTMACLTLAKAPKKLSDGSMSDLDRYLQNKSSGLKVVSDRLIPHLEKTHGVILFDEQITDICIDIANFSFTEGDTLRSAFKKKKFDVIDNLKEKFISGAQAGGLSEQEARSIFSDLERKKDSYTMPKAHAATYVKVAMEQMHLKMNFPDTYMKVYGSKVGVDAIRQEYVQKLGYQIRPLDVLKTPVEGGLKEHNGIRYIVDGLANRFDEKMVNSILSARKHLSLQDGGNANIVQMIHVISENYMGMPLPDPSIQNDNQGLKALIGDIIKLSEKGGFNSLIGDPIDQRVAELTSAIPELVNKIATGRQFQSYQNDNLKVKQSR